MAKKGPYAKGVAKREEILRAALEVIARNGYRGTSVRELADAVGLSQAGLLHYFTSKEELFAEVLRKRDDVDAAKYRTDGSSGVEALVNITRHNAEVPGLVQLHARLSTDATDPEHPAHDFFATRYALLRSELAADIRRRQSGGEVPAGLDPDKLASLLISAADGLQTQWMLDPELDMAGHLEYLWRLLGGDGAS